MTSLLRKREESILQDSFVMPRWGIFPELFSSLQCDHLAHEFDVLGRDNFFEQFALITIRSVWELCYQHFHLYTSRIVFAFFGQQAEVHRTVKGKLSFLSVCGSQRDKGKLLRAGQEKPHRQQKSRARIISLLGSQILFIGVFSNDFATVDFREELCYHSRPKKQIRRSYLKIRIPK